MPPFSDETPPERVPEERGLFLPPRPPPRTAVGAAAPGPEWDPLRRAVPDCVIEGVLADDGQQVTLVGWAPLRRRAVTILARRMAAQDDDAVTRVLVEAAALASIREVHVPPTLALGTVADLAYYVRDWYDERKALSLRLAHGPLSLADFTRLADGVLALLTALHQAGIVHGALSSRSLAWVAGSPVLTDLPWSRQMPPPRFRAPEYQDNLAAGIPGDIYAAGALLYEARTGQAWNSKTAEKALDAVSPAGLRRTLSRALAPSPAARWPDTLAFQRALRRPHWLPWICTGAA